MRTVILYIAVLTFYIQAAGGQTTITLDKPHHFDATKQPLVLVDSFKTGFNYLVLDPGKIDSINIIKDSTALLKFGDAGKYGVIIIHPNPYATFLRVPDILAAYKLPGEDKKLRICINNILMQDAQLILIEKSEIENVEVTTDRHSTDVEDANPGGRFINIITRIKG